MPETPLVAVAAGLSAGLSWAAACAAPAQKTATRINTLPVNRRITILLHLVSRKRPAFYTRTPRKPSSRTPAPHGPPPVLAPSFGHLYLQENPVRIHQKLV